MADEKNNSGGMSTNADRFIADYQEAYSSAIQDARDAAITTATPMHQSNYAHQMAEHFAIIGTLAAQLIKLGKACADYDTNEHREKAIADCVKKLKTERIVHDGWKARSVAVYSEKVAKCDEIIGVCRREAKRIETDSPMDNHGFYDYVEAMIARWPTVSWDESRGIVTVTLPPAAGNKASGG